MEINILELNSNFLKEKYSDIDKYVYMLILKGGIFLKAIDGFCLYFNISEDFFIENLVSRFNGLQDIKNTIIFKNKNDAEKAKQWLESLEIYKKIK